MNFQKNFLRKTLTSGFGSKGEAQKQQGEVPVGKTNATFPSNPSISGFWIMCRAIWTCPRMCTTCHYSLIVGNWEDVDG
jgi:hypothetical protein